MKVTLNKAFYIPSFSSTKRTTYQCGQNEAFTLPRYNRELSIYTKETGQTNAKILVSNSTDFFRPDLPWNNLGKIFNKHFPEGKVNIHNFACSDGSETYSLIISLIEQLGEKEAQRFFPIQASDVDCEIIRMANSGKINATDYDIIAIKNQIKDGDINKYFDVTSLGYNKNILAPKEILTKNVIFETLAMDEGLDKLKKGNNIILARNFWKYLSPESLTKTSWKLREKCDKSTLLLIGKFDLTKGGSIPLHLAELGFDHYNDSKENENILCYKSNLANPLYQKSYSFWERRTKHIHDNYLPSYMK